MFLGASKGTEWLKFRRLLQKGEPVVFTSNKKRFSPSDQRPRCYVNEFYAPKHLGREKPESDAGSKEEIQEHLDVPMHSDDLGLIGKITIDNKWHATLEMPSLDGVQRDRLKLHAAKMAGAIEKAMQIPQSALYAAVAGILPTDYRFILY